MPGRFYRRASFILSNLLIYNDLFLAQSLHLLNQDNMSGGDEIMSSFIQEFEKSFPNLPLDFNSFAKRLSKVDLETAQDSAEAQQMLLRTALIAVRAAEREIARQKNRITKLESLSITDETSGLLNRRGFQREVARALSNARRKNKKGVLVICDLDGFKAINDTFGHAAGDEVLIQIAELLNENVRKTDSVARLGGDEFAILMMDTTEEKAAERAAQLNHLINSYSVRWQGNTIPVRASFGVTTIDPAASATDLYKAADLAMYAHKRDKHKKSA